LRNFSKMSFQKLFTRNFIFFGLGTASNLFLALKYPKSFLPAAGNLSPQAHMSCSHTNLKPRDILAEFSPQEHILYWICFKLITPQGAKWRLSSSKIWQEALLNTQVRGSQKLEEILKRRGETHLFCSGIGKYKTLS